MTDLAPLVDALDANRSGRLSPPQQDEFRRALAWRSHGFVGRFLRTRDAFATDILEGRVDLIEGAVGKRVDTFVNIRQGETVSTPEYRISVANRTHGYQEFRSPGDLFDAVPEAGFVRLFFLPRSRWAINFEPVPDASHGEVTDENANDLLIEQVNALHSPDKVAQAEARARIDDLTQQVDGMRRQADT